PWFGFARSSDAESLPERAKTPKTALPGTMVSKVPPTTAAIPLRGAQKNRGAVKAPRPVATTGLLHSLGAGNRELAERDAKVAARAGAGQRHRHGALGQHLRRAALDQTGIGFTLRIVAEQFRRRGHIGELGLAALDLVLADGQAAADGDDADRIALAVVAAD